MAYTSRGPCRGNCGAWMRGAISSACRVGTRGCPGGGAEVKPGHSATGSGFLFGCRVCDTVNSACVPAGLRTRGAGDVCSYARAGARWGQPRGRPSYGMRTLHPIEVRTSGPVPFYLRREFLRFVSAAPAAGRRRQRQFYIVCNNSTFPRASGSGWRVRGVRIQCAPRSTGARTCTPDRIT